MRRSLALAVLILTIVASAAFAQSPEDVQRVARRLNCPTCQGVNLADCPTQTCAQWRALIKAKLTEGLSDDQVVRYFVEQYGEHVLNAPPARGFNLVGYAMPVIALTIGAAAVGLAWRAWSVRRGPAAATAGATALPPEYVRRLEDDLKDYPA